MNESKASSSPLKGFINPSWKCHMISKVLLYYLLTNCAPRPPPPKKTRVILKRNMNKYVQKIKRHLLAFYDATLLKTLHGNKETNKTNKWDVVYCAFKKKGILMITTETNVFAERCRASAGGGHLVLGRAGRRRRRRPSAPCGRGLPTAAGARTTNMGVFFFFLKFVLQHLKNKKIFFRHCRVWIGIWWKRILPSRCFLTCFSSPPTSDGSGRALASSAAPNITVGHPSTINPLSDPLYVS